MIQRENAVVDECFYALSHYGFYVVPKPNSGMKWEWPNLDTETYVGIVWKANTGAAKIGRSFVRFGIPGLPDIQGWLFADGSRVAIEVKTETGKLSDAQSKHLDLAKRTGCIAFVARGYQDIEKELKALGFKRR